MYVNDVVKSTEFYSGILESAPVEQYHEFSVFVLSENFILGLQFKSGIDPEPQPQFGGFELCMSDTTNQDVDAVYLKWRELNVQIIMKPTMLDFGYTFVAVDPDGHRLRVCATNTTNVD